MVLVMYTQVQLLQLYMDRCCSIIIIFHSKQINIFYISQISNKKNDISIENGAAYTFTLKTSTSDKNAENHFRI